MAGTLSDLHEAVAKALSAQQAATDSSRAVAAEIAAQKAAQAAPGPSQGQ